MKYSELTDEEICDLIGKGHRFTTEEMTVKDAIDTFKPFNGKYWKSYFLLENIIPQEYMDSKEFFMAIMTTRYPVTYGSVLQYASDRLKNDRELVDQVIKEHSGSAISALVRYKEPHKISEKELAELRSNPDVYVKEQHNSDGELVYYAIKSNLLRDQEFVKYHVENGDASVAGDLMQYSEICRESNELSFKCLQKNTSSIYFMDDAKFEDKNYLVDIITLLMETKEYRILGLNEKKLGGEKNKRVAALSKLCAKIDELPANAKIRKAIYEKMADFYLKKLAQEIEKQKANNATV